MLYTKWTDLPEEFQEAAVYWDRDFPDVDAIVFHVWDDVNEIYSEFMTPNGLFLWVSTTDHSARIINYDYKNKRWFAIGR